MGENSKIEWCDHTFNPWMGCTKVSKGCMNCYAERDMDHRWGKVEWGKRGTRIRTGPKNWAKPVKWNKRAKENGKVELVFTASLADIFEDWQARHHDPYLLDDWRGELFELMMNTPWLVWLVLTKRPENVLDMVPDIWKVEGLWPQNVWIGFSAEDQSNFDFRIGPALMIPTPVLWISAEPLLGAISMDSYLEYNEIQWVIAGGESGPGARPTWASWARLLKTQTWRHGIPFFFKQWGEWLPKSEAKEITKFLAEYDDNSEAFHIGREQAGHLINGEEIHEFPDYLEEYEQRLLETEEANYQTKEFNIIHP